MTAGKIIIAALAVLSSPVAAETLPLNPDVRPDTLEQTICVRGWTKTVRPDAGYTGSVKRELMANAGVYDPSSVKLDHVIPLALGGSPADVRNLRLEETSESRFKDRVEVCLSRSVCAGRITLQEAQIAIWTNWKTAGRLCAGYRVLTNENE